MRSNTLRMLAIGVLLALGPVVRGDESPAVESREKIVAAVERGVALIEKGARNYPTQRQCFACHHQTLPLLATGEAHAARVKTDEALPATLVAFTAESFRSQLDDLKAGENIGGKGLTVGYGLWTMRLADTKPDEVTETMVTYLLKTQEPDGHWEVHSVRPPAEESLIICTVIAASGVQHYAAPVQRENAAAAVNKARMWIASSACTSQEDKIARLWGLKLLGGSNEEISMARQIVLAAQRADGGWGQTSEMESDAYATGSTLFVLLEAGVAPGDLKLQCAIEFLLKSQLDDGSWHVKTRAKPVQKFFDNGDPHGKDQFISIAGTCWAVAALARTVQKE